MIKADFKEVLNGKNDDKYVTPAALLKFWKTMKKNDLLTDGYMYGSNDIPFLKWNGTASVLASNGDRVYFRPNGITNDAGQVYVTSGGNLVIDDGCIIARNKFQWNEPVFTRLIFYGSHHFVKSQWNSLVQTYGVAGGGEPDPKPGHHRWYRMAVWRNDNATSSDGLVIGLFDNNGQYRGEFSFALCYGSGTNDRGSWVMSNNALDYDVVNMGWVDFNTIVPDRSNGTQGYLFCALLCAFDVPDGLNPNNYDF